jgi:hypothetical protein
VRDLAENPAVAVTARMTTEAKQNQYYWNSHGPKDLLTWIVEENSKRGPLHDQRAEALQIRSSMNTPTIGAPCR